MAALIRALGTVALCALNLRTVLAAIGAAGPQLESLLGGGSGLGAASTVSVLLIAASAPMAVALSDRFSPRAVVIAALAGTVAAQACLGIPSVAAIWPALVVAGLSSGLIGSLLPTVIRELAPRSAGVATGVMMASTSVGLLVASVAVTTSVDATGGWTAGTLTLAALAAVCLFAWIVARGPRERLGRAEAERAPIRIRSAFRLPWVLALTAYLGVQSFVLFAQLAWLVPTLTAVGVDTLTAGQLLAVFTSLQLVTGIGAPIVAQHTGRPGVVLTASGVLVLAGSAGVLVVVSGAVPTALPLLWAAAAALALGHGAAFALVNLLIAERSASASASVENAGAVMLISQGIGALGALVFGVVRDATGADAAPWLLLAIAAAGQFALGPVCGRVLAERTRASTPARVPR